MTTATRTMLFAFALPTLAAAPLLETGRSADEVHVERLEPADIFALEYASDPQIAPDGTRIVYVRNFMDVMSDRRRSNLWIVDTDSESAQQRPLTSGEANHSSPRWSPDGGRLAWVSNEGGSSQIHVRWMDSGETARVTQLEHGPGNLAWSPDGTRLAFTAFVPEPVEPLIEMPARPEGAEWAPPARVITDYIYRNDGAGYRDAGNTHLFVVPAEGNAPRQLTSGEFDVESPSWASDDSLVFSANLDQEHEPLNSDLFLVDLQGQRVHLINREGPDRSPAVSPDGSLIAYVGCDDEQKGYLPNLLWVAGIDGDGGRCLTVDFDRNIESPVWSSDGAGVFVSYSEFGNTKIAFVPIAGAGPEGGIVPTPVTDNVGGTSIGRPYASGSFSVSDNDQVAFTLTTPEHPADVALAERGQFGWRRLTALNDDLFEHKALAEVRELSVLSSVDQRPIQSWLALPPGFDETELYPLILEIHGGPFANYGDRFSAEIQLYAAAGYVVLYCNPRGSTSYGAEFGNLIDMVYPNEDYDDLMSAVHTALEQGFVDEQRLFVTGGSGGGVLTAWIVGKTNEFRAAVVAKPVINWLSFALTADAYNFFWRYWFPGAPWENVEHYWKRSPLSLVGNVSTPTMLLTGEDDYRTPISESEQYYQALKMRGVETAFVRIPGAGHGIAARPSHLISKVLHVLAWFESHDLAPEDEPR